MYFFEWLSWLAAIDPKEEREAFEKQNKTIKKKDIYEDEEEESIAAAKKSVCAPLKAVAQSTCTTSMCSKCAAACGRTNVA
ncbi:hypothetical protein MXB02_10855 [Pseudomonas mosselii]|uniref:hypothetical protein n=1 Tax=Pseudomonas mosselii TaxID=78327 RepID=UPI001675E251|nr:hypothetical protein [Pseudomonas mosselii]UPF06084.1 hypothetical protein MXB02_10855 [Pseudomonas mosselii]